MQATLPANVTNHYRRNRDTYDRIRTRLSNVRNRFLSASRSDQILMLQQSHSFAVISVQTPVHIHEQAFKNLWSGIERGRPPVWNLSDGALDSVNYHKNKADYIRHSLDHGNLWDRVADMLENGQIDTAHKFILDNMMGVGPAKAPFVLSMLGFEEKMCIDTNIVNAFELDGHATTVVVEKYDALCNDLRNQMPTMRDMTTPFVFQWVVFDYMRGEVSEHDAWFDVIL